MEAGSRRPDRPGLAHQVADRADVIVLSCVPGKAVGPGDTAPQTAMNDHQSLS